MKKKYISGALVLIMVLQYMITLPLVSYADESGFLMEAMEFTGGTAPGVKLPSEGTVSYESEPDCLVVKGGTSNYAGQTIFSFNALTKGYSEVRFLYDKDSATTNSRLVLQGAGGNAFELNLNANATASIASGSGWSSSFSINSASWNVLKVYFDVANSTQTIWMNDTLIKTDSFRGSITNVSKWMCYYNSTTNIDAPIMKYDYVRFWEPVKDQLLSKISGLSLGFDDIRGTNASKDAVSDNLSLPTTTSNGLNIISWTSSDESVISNTGAVSEVTTSKTVTLTPVVGLKNQCNEAAQEIDENGVTLSADYAFVNASPIEITVIPKDVLTAAKNALTFDTFKGGNESADNITEYLSVFPTDGPMGTQLVWTVLSKAPIDTLASIDFQTGAVVRPKYNKEDATVVIRAEIFYDGKSTNKDFTLTIKKMTDTPDVTIAKAYDALGFDIIKGENEDSLSVISNLDLCPSFMGVETQWSADSEAISADGTVLRPAFPNPPVDVKLTAVLSLEGGTSKTKEIAVKVLPIEPTDDELIESISNECFTFADIKGSNVDSGSVISSLFLPKSVEIANTYPTSSAVVTWSANPTGFINTQTGAVTRPTYIKGDKTIELVPTYKSGEVTKTGAVISVTIPKLEATGQDKVDYDLAMLSEDDFLSKGSTITAVIGVKNPMTAVGGTFGSAIAWSSDNESCLSPSTGEISRPAMGENAASVILTATATLDGYTATRQFHLYIAPYEPLGGYLINEDFLYSSMDEMFEKSGITKLSNLDTTDAEINDSYLSMTQTGSTSSGVYVPLANEMENPTAQYFEVKLKRNSTKANLQIKFYGTTSKATNVEYAILDLSSGSLSWKSEGASWTGGGKITTIEGMNGTTIQSIVDEDITIKIKLDFKNRQMSEIYINGNLQTGVTAPFYASIDKVSSVGLIKNGNATSGTTIYFDSVRMWRDEQDIADAEAESIEFSQLTNEHPSSVTKNLTLPSQTELYDMDVTWSSNNESVISSAGVVARPAKGNEMVVMTATVTMGNVKATKEFYINVTGLEPSEEESGLYNVYRDSFNSISPNWTIESAGSATWGIEDGKLKLGINASGDAVNGKLYFIDSDSSFAVDGKVYVMADIGAKNAGNYTSSVYSNKNEEIVKLVMNKNEFYFVTGDGETTHFSRANGDYVMVKYVVDTTAGKVTIYQNNMLVGEYQAISQADNVYMMDCILSGSADLPAYMNIDNAYVSIPNESRLAIAKRQVNFDYIRKNNLEEKYITGDLNLTENSFLNTKIQWTSSNNDIISTLGNVTRPKVSSADVTLSAKISLGENSESFVTNSFDLRVIKYNPDNLALEKNVTSSLKTAAESDIKYINDGFSDTAFTTANAGSTCSIIIDLGEEKNVSLVKIFENATDGIYGINEFAIETSTDKSTWNTISTGGKTNGSVDALVMPHKARYVKLNVTKKQSGTPISISELEILYQPTDEQIVSADMDSFNPNLPSTVTASKINLPKEGEFGSNISWSSSPNLISADGQVTFPAYDTSVNMTVTFTSGSVTKTKIYKLTVKGTNSGNGGSSSGGGGGSSSSSNKYGAYTPPTSTDSTDVIPTEELLFKDINEASWAKEYITDLYNKNIVAGAGNEMFYPNKSITREEFAKMLAVALSITNTGSNCEFTDVDSSAWYYTYICSLVDANIVKGISNDEFGLGAYIAREDMVTMAARALEYLGVDLEISNKEAVIEDETAISNYALEFVKKFVGAGIISGDNTGRFNSRNFATRAEVAKMISVLLAKMN